MHTHFNRHRRVSRSVDYADPTYFRHSIHSKLGTTTAVSTSVLAREDDEDDQNKPQLVVCKSDEAPSPEHCNPPAKRSHHKSEVPCYFFPAPQQILLVIRSFSDDITAIATALCFWMQQEFGICVVVEDAAITDMQTLGVRNVKVWTRNMHRNIDLVISLGGDGTTLWVSTMFPDVVPPVVGVTLGSVSYLNQFHVEEIMDFLKTILTGDTFEVQLRSRILIHLRDETGRELMTSHCVNEIVIDKGPAAGLAMVDVDVDDCYFTTVAADGLILASPTGSTAYSMAAGGAVVHPHVPCILFTPICPHSLSMRPLILPDSSKICLRNPPDSRNSLWVSVDGRQRHELKKGQSAVALLSHCPFPLVSKRSSVHGDLWMQALTGNLKWNLRARQRKHDVSSDADRGLETKSVLDFSLPDSLRKWCETEFSWHTGRDSVVINPSKLLRESANLSAET